MRMFATSPCCLSRRLLFGIAVVVSSALLWTPAAAGACSFVPPPPGTYTQPVVGAIVDGYRPPATFAGPGNRGWEYRTTPGAVVRSAGAGVVAFAGPIGGRRYVSVDHADGRRTTYSGLAAISVGRGERLVAGQQIGIAGTTLHFGVRCGSTYQDPALLFAFGALPGPPHLIPINAH